MNTKASGLRVPVIDMSPILKGRPERADTARAIHDACVESGFFYVINHGVDEDLQARLESVSKQFFDLPQADKMHISMSMGGRAWRGYFPLGNEMTSGIPDQKEGIYFGTECTEEHDRVKRKTPLFGRNLFPSGIPEMAYVVLAYIEAMTDLGHAIIEGISLSLGLDARFLRDQYMYDPLCLFRIFHYPETADHDDHDVWGVGEHTDYGVLTILKQDDVGGLQIKSRNGWLEAPYLPGTFVCNIGDMLERMTGGYYLSTPHRVKNRSTRSRYSYPFFFDPNFDAQVDLLPITRKLGTKVERYQRWDDQDVHAFTGTYGEYIMQKVGKVFPHLIAEI